MKKWVAIFLALTLLTTFSIGYAETKVDSLSGKSCAISATDKDLEKIQKSETEQKPEAKVDTAKIKPGTIFTLDKDLEKIQKNGF